jgi:hypothetical protein
MVEVGVGEHSLILRGPLGHSFLYLLYKYSTLIFGLLLSYPKAFQNNVELISLPCETQT